MAAALRLQGGALLGAADAFGELTSSQAPPPAVPSPAGTPTGAVAAVSGGSAGFGGGVPPAVALSGPPSHTTSDGGNNPYHTSSLSGGAAGAPGPGGNPGSYASSGGAASVGGTKRFSEPEPAADVAPGMGADGGPAAGVRYPVAPSGAADQPPSDNPYSSVRSYQYA